MFELFDMVRLRHAQADLGLPAGSCGAVVLVHDHRAYEVEFVDDAGRTLALGTLPADELEPADTPALAASRRRP